MYAVGWKYGAKKHTIFRFQDMITSLKRAIKRFPDKRTGENTTYTMTDAAAGAFSIFFTQCGSFLAHQKFLEERYGLSNSKTLFGMEHNYGHGGNHLASLLATMNILAFLFHTMLEFMDEKYRLLRKTVGSRATFFNDICTLLKHLCFRSFDRLMEFMVESRIRLHDPDLFPVPV